MFCNDSQIIVQFCFAPRVARKSVLVLSPLDPDVLDFNFNYHFATNIFRIVGTSKAENFR